jgi:hypothetical protein
MRYVDFKKLMFQKGYENWTICDISHPLYGCEFPLESAELTEKVETFVANNKSRVAGRLIYNCKLRFESKENRVQLIEVNSEQLMIPYVFEDRNNSSEHYQNYELYKSHMEFEPVSGNNLSLPWNTHPIKDWF